MPKNLLIPTTLLMILSGYESFVLNSAYNEQYLTRTEPFSQQTEQSTALPSVGVTSIPFFAPDSDERNRRKDMKNAVPEITNIIGHIDYEEFLIEDDRLCVVLFSASWCKNCQAFKLKYKNKLVRDQGDLINPDSCEIVRRGITRFAEVDYSDNKVLCEQKGILKVPYIRMYKSGHLLTEFDCGPSSFPQVVASMKALQKS